MKLDFYTTDWCGDCIRSKALLKKLNIVFNEINVDTNLEANEYIKSLQVNQRRIPTIVFDDGSFLVEPSDIDLENKQWFTTANAPSIDHWRAKHAVKNPGRSRG